MSVSMDRFTFVDPPEPRIIGYCPECGRELREDDELRKGLDDNVYCDAVCAGYGQSRLYCPAAEGGEG